MPILYIRFNPHFYEKDGACFDPDLKTRFQALLDVLRTIKNREITLINATGLNLIYFYYDQYTDGVTNSDKLAVFRDCDAINAEFANCLAPCVLLVN
jgi:hypothetical protein